MTVVSEPEVAVAIGRCLNARSIARPDRPATTPSHTRPCGWCDYPLEDLRRMVEGFNAWSDYSARSNTFGHHELRVWSELPRDEQERRIVAAQAYPDEPKPAPPAASVDEEGPTWAS